jgi:hypothetical protein
LAVVISGRDKGRITDFEGGDGKGMSPLGFIQSELRLASMGETVRWAKEWLGLDRADDYSARSTSAPNNAGGDEHEAEAERDEHDRRAKAARIRWFDWWVKGSAGSPVIRRPASFNRRWGRPTSSDASNGGGGAQPWSSASIVSL